MDDNKDAAILFTRNGLGDAPQELQQKLAAKFLTLLLNSQDLPAVIVFYTEGVKLACQGSPVLDQLRQIESQGTRLVLCSTCLEFFGLAGQVAVGIVGGMGDILTALQAATKVVSL